MNIIKTLKHSPSKLTIAPFHHRNHKLMHIGSNLVDVGSSNILVHWWYQVWKACAALADTMWDHFPNFPNHFEKAKAQRKKNSWNLPPPPPLQGYMQTYSNILGWHLQNKANCYEELGTFLWSCLIPSFIKRKSIDYQPQFLQLSFAFKLWCFLN